MKTKIYCGITGSYGNGCFSDVAVTALAEDGEYLAGHISSNEDWAKNDIGYNLQGVENPRGPGASKLKHYAEKYPDGFELIWVDDVHNDERWKAAYEKNQAIPDEEW